jgi:hypothetical protein
VNCRTLPRHALLGFNSRWDEEFSYGSVFQTENT